MRILAGGLSALLVLLSTGGCAAGEGNLTPEMQCASEADLSLASALLDRLSRGTTGEGAFSITILRSLSELNLPPTAEQARAMKEIESSSDNADDEWRIPELDLSRDIELENGLVLPLDMVKNALARGGRIAFCGEAVEGQVARAVVVDGMGDSVASDSNWRYLSLSAPGYDSSMAHAIVSFALVDGARNGIHRFAVFSRSDKSWEVVTEAPLGVF